MTAINVVLKKDRGVLLTDAAIYDPNGRILGFGQKAVAIPSLKAAIACRGAQKLTALMAMELSVTFRDFDHIMESGEEFFDHWFATIDEKLSYGTQDDMTALTDVQMLVVGWSDGLGKPLSFFYSSVDEPRFQRVADGYAFGPLPTEEEFANLHTIRCEIENDYRPDGFDPVRHGIPLMEAQRRMRLPLASADHDDEISIVGGHVLLTEVSATGTTQRVIHRWEDVVGWSIEPEPFQAIGSAGGMSRAERRRVEKLQAKAARRQAA